MERFPTKAFIFIAALALGTPAAVQAQTPAAAQATAPAANAAGAWSLQECIDHALKNNLQIQQSRNRTKISRIDVNQAWAAMLPAVNGSASGGINFGSSIDPITSDFRTEQIKSANFSVSGNVSLFAGGQLRNQVKQQQLNEQANLLDAEKTQNDVVLSVVTAYLNILFAEELLKTSQLQYNTTQTQAERTEKLFRAGSVAESSVLEVNAQLATDELNIINAENQKAQAELQLVQLLNLPSADGFEIEKPELPDPDQSGIAASPAQIYDVAQQVMPEIKSADVRIKSAQRGLSVANGAYYPRLGLSASIFSGYSSARNLFAVTGTKLETIGFVNGDLNQQVLAQSPILTTATYAFGDQFNDNLGKSVNLNLSIPIFNGFQARYNVSRQRINLKNAELSAEIARNQLRQQIQTAHADALAAQKKFVSARKQLVAVEQSYRNAELRFNAGVLNTTDFNVAANNYRRAQSDIIQAKFDYIFKLKILDFYQGKSLSF